MVRRLAAMLAALCLLCLPSALGEENKSLAAFSVSWWGDLPTSQATEEAVNSFVKEHKIPKVQFTSPRNRADYDSWLFQNLAKGTAGDMVQVDAEILRSHGMGKDGEHLFADLEPLLKWLDLNQFSTLGLEEGMVEGRLCAVPVSCTSHLLVWNQGALTTRGLEVPLGIEDLLTAASSIPPEEKVYPLAADVQGRIAMVITYVQSKYGRRWTNPQTEECEFTVEQIADGMAYLKNFVDAGVMPPVLEQEDLLRGWYGGRFLGIWSWDTLAEDLRMFIPEGEAITFTAKLQEWIPYSGGFQKATAMFAIPFSSAYPREAAELMEYLLNTRKGAVTLRDTRGIPDSKRGLAYCKESRALDPTRTQANEIARSWARIPMPKGFDTPMLVQAGGIYEQILTGLEKGLLSPTAASVGLMSGLSIAGGAKAATTP